ncbi:UNVERIFIED_CONTAM: Copia protein [Sesamum radiatum]|uniref:Copia protein n=1 Tax=Sesamum radiatum TaxID=300843 RepID=A0AAW2JLZ6_SESRA
MMSFIELHLSFQGYALETVAKLLNMAPSKTVAKTPYQIWHDKPASYKYWIRGLVCAVLLEKGVPSGYLMRGIAPEESSEASTSTDTVTSSMLIFPLTIFPCPPKVNQSIPNNSERLVAKDYTQRPRVDFEETYSSVAMAKSIQIMVAIAAWYDYEIWPMDMKTTFLNGFVEEEMYMDQPEGFTSIGEE